MQCAGNHNLENLIVMIDYNKIQSYGFTEEVADLEPLVDKWKAFNFNVIEVDIIQCRRNKIYS